MSDTMKVVVSVAAVALAAGGGPLLSMLRAALSNHPALPAPPAPPAPPALTGASFSAAFAALAVVRNRLVATNCLDEKAAIAVEEITHALVAGTDK